MKTIFFALLLTLSQAGRASDCETKVIGYYKDIYHRTYAAASNSFLNNFVGRKNMKAHTLGHPDIAFQGLAFNPNYIAEAIVEKSGKSGREVYETYLSLLRSDKLCQDLGEDYKKFGKVRKYLLKAL